MAMTTLASQTQAAVRAANDAYLEALRYALSFYSADPRITHLIYGVPDDLVPYMARLHEPRIREALLQLPVLLMVPRQTGVAFGRTLRTGVDDDFLLDVLNETDPQALSSLHSAMAVITATDKKLVAEANSRYFAAVRFLHGLAHDPVAFLLTGLPMSTFGQITSTPPLASARTHAVMLEENAPIAMICQPRFSSAATWAAATSGGVDEEVFARLITTEFLSQCPADATGPLLNLAPIQRTPSK